MNNLDTSKLLRSLAKLIEKPELKALQFSLIKTLSELIVAESISLFEIRTLKRIAADFPEVFVIPVGYEDNYEEDDSTPPLLNSLPQFDECFRTQGVVVAPLTDT